MKLSCHVIEDLLPLYHDGVCSEESRSLVDEHIEECESCKKMLDALKAEPEVSHVDDSAPLKSIQKKLNKSLTKSCLKGIAIACVVCLCLSFLFYGLTKLWVVPVSADLLEVTEVSRLKDGSIAFHLHANDDRDIRQYGFNVTEDGALYCIPFHTILPEPRRFDMKLDETDFCVSTESQMDFNSIYVGPVGKGILVWEKGMELPAASQRMEESCRNRLTSILI